MSDPREIIADALWRLDGIHTEPDGPNDYHRSNAEALVAKLNAAGLLVEPGGTASTQWGIRWPSGYIQTCPNQAVAEHDAFKKIDDLKGEVVRRQVTRWPPSQYRTPGARHFGPWHPVGDTP